MFMGLSKQRLQKHKQDDNSSGDEIANMNFFYHNIVHVEASAYAHWTTS